jgi:hypothetical protein
MPVYATKSASILIFDDRSLQLILAKRYSQINENNQQTLKYTK